MGMIDIDSVLVCKSKSKIIVCHDGKKLIIDKNSILFEKLDAMDKQKIKEWYANN